MLEAATRLAAIVAAVLPVAVIITYLFARDRCRPNPGLIGLSLGFGAIAALAVVIFGVIFGPAARVDRIAATLDPVWAGIAVAFIGAAAPEELAKFAVLAGIVMRHEDCMRPADVLIGSIAVALGFAALENVLYVLDNDHWRGTATARAFTAVPGHAINGILMGLWIAVVFDAARRARACFVGVVAAIAFHTLYDAPLFAVRFLDRAARGAASHESIVMCMIAFLAVLAAGGWVAVKGLRHGALTDGGDPVELWPPPGPVRTLLLAPRTWQVVGALLITWGLIAAAVGMVGLVRLDPPMLRLLPWCILPLIFGPVLMRFPVTDAQHDPLSVTRSRGADRRPIP